MKGKIITRISIDQEIIKVREWIPHIGLEVIRLKLFLDIVPSSSVDITRALRGCFRGGSVYVSFRFVLFQSKVKHPTLWRCLLWYFDYKQRRFGSRYVLIHFETLMGFKWKTDVPCSNNNNEWTAEKCLDKRQTTNKPPNTSQATNKQMVESADRRSVPK